jgi:acyl-CoA thioesterase-1
MGPVRRFVHHVVAAFACAILVSGCSSAPASTSTPPSTSPTSTSPTSTSPPATSDPHQHDWSIVALGDSVPHGTSCGCTPYPELSATSLTEPGTREVTAMNDAVGGFTTADVLTQLRSDDDVISQVSMASVVEIEVGANDVAYSGSCGTSVACYQPRIRSTQQNLDEIVARVRDLTAGRPVLLVLLDYWSVWLGGQYAEAKGPAYVDAADGVTDQVNNVIKTTASNTGAAYVDLRAAFKGPNYTYDETRYLASDGDHPNAAGHQQIAAAVVDVVTQTLHL